MTVKALVLAGYGQNCDIETAFAFELAGAKAERVHINTIIEKPEIIEGFDIMAFGGGFSWGDDHGAGVVQATRMRTHLGERLVRFIESGKLVIGICNGFQCLVNLGLLPGLDGDYVKRSVALTNNDCGNFRDDWVYLSVNSSSPCVFTRGLELIELPVRHGEGKFIAEPSVMERLEKNGQLVLRYAKPDGSAANGAFPANPNGAMLDVAGICDPSGRVFGLMPHPEAFCHITNHPEWTYKKEAARRKGLDISSSAPDGLRIFRNAVDYFN